MTAGEDVGVVLHCNILVTCNTIQHRAVATGGEQVPTRRTKGGGYQYGKTGKTYYGKGAKAKADRQGRAIKASQHRSKKK